MLVSRIALLVGASVLFTPTLVRAHGPDIPSEIVVQGFLKQEGTRARLVVRVPLALVDNAALPRRGSGNLDLANADEKLATAAQAIGRQIEIADGAPSIPMVRAARIALPTDHSFDAYESALASLEGPKLSNDNDVLASQGYFDVALDYPLRAPNARVALRSNIAPGIEGRVKLRVTFIPIDATPRTYDIASGGWVALDPTALEAGWLSLKRGFADSFGIDRLVFLVCLIAPFRRFRSLLAVVAIMAGMQALTMTASGARWLADAPWVAPLADVVLAATLLMLAIGNLGAPSLRRRWFVAMTVGAIIGFTIGPLFAEGWQFAGAHALVAALAYNVGIVAGAVIILSAALVALRVTFAFVLGESLGVMVLSALIALIAWQWLSDGVHRFQDVNGSFSPASIVAVARWLLPALLVGGAAYFLPRGFGGERVQSLRDALTSRRS